MPRFSWDEELADVEDLAKEESIWEVKALVLETLDTKGDEEEGQIEDVVVVEEEMVLQEVLSMGRLNATSEDEDQVLQENEEEAAYEPIHEDAYGIDTRGLGKLYDPQVDVIHL